MKSRAKKLTDAREQAGKIWAGLGMLRTALDCGDPEPELRIRINDLIQEASTLTLDLNRLS